MNSITAGHYNVSSVLRLLWLNPRISRVEIADTLGLNRSTVTHIINELMKLGLVKTLAIGDSSPQGGRKKVQLCINKNYGYVAGLELRAECIRTVVVNLAGEIVSTHVIEIPCGCGDLYSRLQSGYQHVKEGVRRKRRRLLGLGCGLAGLVDSVEGLVLQSIPLNIKAQEPIKARAAAFINEPFVIDNDARCCCWGEITRRSKSEDTDFLFILGEWRKIEGRPSHHVTSIGMGLVIGNRVHYGQNFSAGEFRSIGWKPGNTSQFSLSDDQVAVARQDRTVCMLLVRELASNTALLVNMLNLHRVYLGGVFSAEDTEVAEIFAEAIARNWSYSSPPSCEVVFSTLGENAVAFGAAGMMLERIFRNSAGLAAWRGAQRSDLFQDHALEILDLRRKTVP